MITNIARSSEYAHGKGIERKVRAWVVKEYTEEKGHPKGFADDINARMRFVHGDETVDPNDLVCEGCGHKCMIPVD